MRDLMAPSAITITSTSKTVASYGAAYTLSGYLASSDTRLGARRVVLQTAPAAGGPWADTSVAATTSAQGAFSLMHVPRTSTATSGADGEATAT